MSAETLKRPALGQQAKLGMLYDARTDNFLPYSMLKGAPLNEAVNSIEIHPKHQTLTSNNTYKDTFNKMCISSDLGGSILAGFINPEGSGAYLLKTEEDTALNVHQALHYTISTVQESLNFSASNFKELLSSDQLPATIFATHMVSEITWGASCIVAATRKISTVREQSVVEKKLVSAFEAFEWTDEWGFDGASKYPAHLKDEFGEIKVYSDLLDDDETRTDDLDAAHTHFVSLPKLVQNSNDGKGVPILYTLLPIEFLSMFMGFKISTTGSRGHISVECQDKFLHLLDESRVASGLLRDYYRELGNYSICMKPTVVYDVCDRVNEATKANSALRLNYTKLLKDVRFGRANPQDMWHLIETFYQGDSSPKALSNIAVEYAEILAFVDKVEGKGAKYVGYDGRSRREFNDAEQKNSWGDAYIFYFNDTTMKNAESWKEHLDLLFKILADDNRLEKVFVVDCDATGTDIRELHISHFQSNSLMTNNVLKQRKHLSNKCIMRYDPRHLDSSVKDDPWPPRRKMVKISCPGRGPNCKMDHEWICSKCLVPIEYGTDTSYMYCDCGRVKCWGSLYEFDCQKAGHGLRYAQYDNYELLSIMRKLKPPPEINILILGESGVGKSTFINAFINYLTFSSLDHALSATHLNWVIPCSFGISNVDRDSDELLQRVVQVGPSDVDEVSGVKGSSATQKATAYPIYIGGKLIRLIDTPGIGDTRGYEQDKQNMVHTLSVLKNYESLHGILILLKPNNSRLGVMVRFCINELLTHLHVDAAQNFVFGFTNTRATMFTPGDAVGPLKEQLSSYKGIIPGLFGRTTYCFDSEGFRYLAALKQPDELDLGNLPDYQRSWEHSAKESQRLMDYIGQRNPHLVKSTVGLAETRDLINRLVQPMAEIIKAVTKTIADNRKAMDELSKTQLTGAELKTRLNITKTGVEAQQLKDPYTVCNNPACVSRVAGPAGGESVILRKSLCHSPCGLKEIIVNTPGAKGITGCWAFNNGVCKTCTHTPEDHLHIMILWKEKTENTIDPNVQASLNANASTAQIQSFQVNALRQRISELQNEKDLLEEAQAKFSHYLEKNSITVYNDVTAEYLEHLIKDEKAKMETDQPTRASLIAALEASKKKHEDFVSAMRKGKQTQNSSRYQELDQDGVHRLVTSLCAMKHYGQQLRQAENAVKNAYAAQFREKPYRVRRPEHYSFGASSSWYPSGKTQNSGPSSQKKPIRSMLDVEPSGNENPEKSSVAPSWPPEESSNTYKYSEKRPLQGEYNRNKDSASVSQQAPPPYSDLTSGSYQGQGNSKGRGFRRLLQKIFRHSS
ncbi:hypothetical protein BGZ60DRAFT_369431 [Tricladium varicosporioides]|nr:hypothetical protein BGZ60DRAFT_369431 [Hymenoscyphus varicosporioides]